MIERSMNHLTPFLSVLFYSGIFLWRILCFVFSFLSYFFLYLHKGSVRFHVFLMLTMVGFFSFAYGNPYSGAVYSAFLSGSILLLLGLFPFNYHIPNIWEKGPPIRSFFLETITRIAGLFAFFQFRFLFIPYSMSRIVNILAFTTLIMSSFCLPRQRSFKRMWAYFSSAYFAIFFSLILKSNETIMTTWEKICKIWGLYFIMTGLMIFLVRSIEKGVGYDHVAAFKIVRKRKILEKMMFFVLLAQGTSSLLLISWSSFSLILALSLGFYYYRFLREVYNARQYEGSF